MNKSESKYFNTAARMDQAFLELLETKDFEYITVKEICAKAQVNRSTFYLHYETIGDLLAESIRFISQKFLAYFVEGNENFLSRITEADADDLYLVTPEYLTPYLNFIKDYKRLFYTAIVKGGTLGSHDSMNVIADKIIHPILDKYGVPQSMQKYIIPFYIEGIIAIIKVWIEDNCQEEIPAIEDIIMSCVQKPTGR